MSKQKQADNYADYIPVKNPQIDSRTEADGTVTVLIEWTGFYHRIAQRFFRRPRVSEIALDPYGSFLWNAIDGETSVYTLSQALEQAFPGMEKPLSRLIKFLEIMRDHHLIHWKGETK